jgi:hypothetical protein
MLTPQEIPMSQIRLSRAEERGDFCERLRQHMPPRSLTQPNQASVKYVWPDVGHPRHRG